MTSGMRQAKQPVSALTGPYGHPLYPMLVTVPIGNWVARLAYRWIVPVANEAAVRVRGVRHGRRR